MTTIGSTPQFTSCTRGAATDQTKPSGDFSGHIERAASNSAALSTNKVEQLKTELETLKRNQLSMSISDYLFSKFSLQDQIVTEKRNAGETIDTFAVSYEGQVFNIEGRFLGRGSDLLRKAADADMAPVVSPKTAGTRDMVIG